MVHAKEDVAKDPIILVSVMTNVKNTETAVMTTKKSAKVSNKYIVTLLKHKPVRFYQSPPQLLELILGLPRF